MLVAELLHTQDSVNKQLILFLCKVLECLKGLKVADKLMIMCQ